MSDNIRIGVASRSFSQHPVLKAELLARYSNIRFNDLGKSLSGADLVNFLKGCDRAITGLEEIRADVLEQLPGLRLISKYGVGLDMIDLRALEERRVKLGWMPGVNRRSVAELAVGFMIMLSHRVPEAHCGLLKGKWGQLRGRQLSDLTVGIVGCGHVGKEVALLLEKFGCRLLAFDIVDYSDFYSLYGVTPVSLDDLLRRSDIVTIHLPFDSSTRNLLSASKLSLMKKGALLVNAARGGLIDETALSSMLETGHLAGAALDVFSEEPPGVCSLFSSGTFLGSCHMGGSTEQAVLTMGRAAIEGLETALLPSELKAKYPHNFPRDF